MTDKEYNADLGELLTGKEVTIPEKVMNALKERGHTPEQIADMPVKEIFKEFCEWEGLINWGELLWEIVDTLTIPTQEVELIVGEQAMTILHDLHEAMEQGEEDGGERKSQLPN